jgi:multidrug efflux pump subunit AcrA (membrane-fusion protein)
MKTAIATGLFMAAALLTSCSKEPAIQAKHDTGPVQVKVAKVTAREVQRVVDTVGTLFPLDETIISAEIDGRVDEVKVDLGDRVAAGQVIVHIQDEEQRYLLAQMEAQMRQSMERLGLKDEKEKVEDIRETPEPRRARAELFEAEQRFKRIKNLVDQGISSRSELDQAESRFKSLQAAYDSSLYQTRNIIQEVERYRAQLDLQRKKLRDATVTAPFAGSIKERHVNVGQFVRPNTPLMTMVKTDPLRLRIEVPERMAPWIKTGQVAQVLVEAFTDRTFTGRIWRISPMVDQTKRTFVVEALIDNPRDELKPGSYARARIPTNKVERIRLLPSRAITYLFGTNKAFVVKGDTIDARDLRLGDRYDQDVEIVEGVEDGEQVATTQLNRLDTGVKVQITDGSEQPRRGM